MTDEELKKAAEEYAPDLPSYNAGGLYIPPTSNQDLRDAFIAGAEWRKKQMMKEAVETEVTETCGISSVWIKTKQFKPGQKVRVIFIKEEENGQSD